MAEITHTTQRRDLAQRMDKPLQRLRSDSNFQLVHVHGCPTKLFNHCVFEKKKTLKVRGCPRRLPRILTVATPWSRAPPRCPIRLVLAKGLLSVMGTRVSRSEDVAIKILEGGLRSLETEDQLFLSLPWSSVPAVVA